MRFQRLKRGGAEKVYATFKNKEARQLLPGEPVCVDFVTDKDGSTIAEPANTSVHFPAGVIVKTIGTSGNFDDTGEILVYGYAEKIKVNAADTINAGDPLSIVAGSSSFVDMSVTTEGEATDAELVELANCIAIAGTTIGASTENQTIGGFVRAL